MREPGLLKGVELGEVGGYSMLSLINWDEGVVLCLFRLYIRNIALNKVGGVSKDPSYGVKCHSFWGFFSQHYGLRG
jgi:hypothetical protein